MQSFRSEESSFSTASQALAKLPWYRRHLGTDMLVAAYLWLLACVIYLGYSIYELSKDWYSAKQWCDVVSSAFFVYGCVVLCQSSYTSYLLRLAEQIKRPPTPLTFCEEWYSSNLLLKTTQLFMMGTIPFMLEGFFMILAEPTGFKGYGLLLGLTSLLPLLCFWTYTAKDENLRLNGGGGSSYVWDWMLKHGVCGWRPAAKLKRHIGKDGHLALWIMAALAGSLITLITIAIPVCPLLQLDSLCPETGFLLFLWFVGALLSVGMALMVYATYPENFNSSLFFDGAPPEPMEEEEEEEEEEIL